MIRMPGAYKNFEELEDNLTLEELEVLISKARSIVEDTFRFQASLKGIELPRSGDSSEGEEGVGQTPEDRLESVKRRAAARIAGKSPEQIEFEEMGMTYIVEDGSLIN